MKVLVIGGTRLIGKVLVELLIKSGAEVTLVTRGQALDDFGNSVRRIKLDVMDSVSVFQYLPREFFDIVYDMLVLAPDHVKERLSVLDCKKYVMISSAGVYKDYHIGIKESEYKAQEEKWEYCGYDGITYDVRKRYAESALVTDYYGIPSVRVRFPVVLSEFDYTKRILWYVKHIFFHLPMYINNLDEKHAYIPVEDAGKFLYRLCRSDQAINQLFENRAAVNVAGEGVISPREICQCIESLSGKKAEYQNAGVESAPFNDSATYSLNTDLAKKIGFSFTENKDYLLSVIRKNINVLGMEKSCVGAMPSYKRLEELDMRIYLRPITKEDTDIIVKWRNSSKVSSHCLNKKPITRESHLEFFEKNVVTGYYQQYIVERMEEQSGVVSYPIATVYLKDIDRVNCRCELCIFTSDDEEWNTESQAIAVKMLLNKAFVELNMHKVYSYVFYKYIDEADLLKKAGFTTEAILKNEAVDENGKFDDIVRFSIINSNLMEKEQPIRTA